MIPCITNDTIKLLAGTADERYNYSPNFFRKTHYSQTLKRYYNNKFLDKVTETDLLHELKDLHLFGNRIYFIFGSTGSGKSELLCWLKDQWILSEEKRPIIRISRSELNPQVLIKKCYETLGIDINDTIVDQNKWNLLIKKPVSIMNQIIWNSLSEIFDDDEDIVNVAFLLRPVIERNIKEFATNITKNTNIKSLHILSESEFKEIIENTTIPINVNYLILLDTLSKYLDYFIFNGHNISNLLKSLSNYLLEKKIRPLLLIDDLVQSINIYAADILDHFITLEEGNWDVVVGLTPGVLQETNYSDDLMRRLQTLDTIDDRVKKMWLSDESGQSSYTINRGQSQRYLEKYLMALKESHGFNCSVDCTHSKTCRELLIGKDAKLEQIPLNYHLINRIYDGVMQGKGVLRYMILHSREILHFLLTGNRKGTMKIQKLLFRDCFVSHEDETIKLLGEMYADGKGKTVTLPLPLLKQFHHHGKDNLKLPVRKVLYQNNEIDDEIETFVISNHQTEHVRNWIEGKTVKLELLEPVRLGIATIMNDALKATAISRKYTARAAKASTTIQKTEIIKRSKYPISFKINSKKQILVKKHINLLVINKFQKLKISERPEVFREISDDINVSQWFYQTLELQSQWLQELETELTMPVSKFAFNLRKLVFGLDDISKKEWTSKVDFPIDESLLETVMSMFLDWFSLRDNIIDYELLSKFEYDDSFEDWLSSFRPSKRANKFSINNIPFSDFIYKLQIKVGNYLENLSTIINEHLVTLKQMNELISDNSHEIYTKLENLLADQVENETSLKSIYQLDDLLHWCENAAIYEKFELLLEKQSELRYVFEQFTESVQKSMSLLECLEMQLPERTFLPYCETIALDKVDIEIMEWQYRTKLSELFHDRLQAIPVQVLRAFRGNTFIFKKGILDKWTVFLEAGLQIRNGKYTEHTLNQLNALVDIDFLEVLTSLEKRTKIMENAKIILPALNTTSDLKEVDDVAIYLKEVLKLRPQLRYHLIQMIEDGQTRLPQSQWRGIISDLERLCPETYNELSVSLSINK